MNIQINSVSISAGQARLIGDSEGRPAEVDLPLDVFHQFCRDHPAVTFPFSGLVTRHPETDEPFFYLLETL